jgi:hypothetical protein
MPEFQLYDPLVTRKITLCDEPGIGAEVDPAFLERCEHATVA